MSRLFSIGFMLVVTGTLLSGRQCYASAYKTNPVAFSSEDSLLLEEISRASFQFFWREAHHDSGLVRDKTGLDWCSVASVGFGLAVLPIGVERGYITREEGYGRALKSLRTLSHSTAQHEGVFCHFIDFSTGQTTQLGYESVASSVDTALLVAGAIVAGEYFGEDVKLLAEQLAFKVNWKAFVNPENGQVYMAWIPKSRDKMNGDGKFDGQTWDWYTDETLLIVLLGLASENPNHRLTAEAMTTWRRPVGRYKDGEPYVYTWTGALFTYIFAHCFYDFRLMGNDMSGIDWYENTSRAVDANRRWCQDHSSKFSTYRQNLWGITSGSGPQGSYIVPGHRPCGSKTDNPAGGTLHPYGAGMSVPFAPKDAVAALRTMRELKVDGHAVWKSQEEGGYGFWDGFNVDQKWVSDHVIGIAHGPMLLMIENARTGLIWRLMMQNESIQNGIKRAGFKMAKAT